MPVMAFDAQDVPPAAAARGLRNYWGYSTPQLLEPAPALLPRAGAGGARVPRADRRAARRGHRRAPRRRLQPHGRRRRVGPDLTSRASTTTSSTCSIRPTGAATATSPAAATPSTATIRWYRLHRPLPEYWVERPRRRRLPLRPRQRPRPRRARRVMADPPLPWAIESSPMLAEHR